MPTDQVDLAVEIHIDERDEPAPFALAVLDDDIGLLVVVGIEDGLDRSGRIVRAIKREIREAVALRGEQDEVAVVFLVSAGVEFLRLAAAGRLALRLARRRP